MMTNKEIYGLHTSHDSEPSELYEAYRDVPLDSLDESQKNNTPLHTACHFADMTAVGILLDRGADPNVKNNDGDTPLCVMARRTMPTLPACFYPKGRECHVPAKTRPP